MPGLSLLQRCPRDARDPSLSGISRERVSGISREEGVSRISRRIERFDSEQVWANLVRANQAKPCKSCFKPKFNALGNAVLARYHFRLR